MLAGLMLIRGERMEMEKLISELWDIGKMIRKVIRLVGVHLEKHTLSGLDGISNHTITLRSTAANDSSSLLGGGGE